MVRLGSLCSGYGGLDMAAEWVFGAETVWHAENAPAPSRVLAARWPGVPNYGDITTIDFQHLDPVDILTAGYPCQPFSLSAAGRRKGVNDERHLWPFVREAIRCLRPRLTLLENVAGHRSLGFDRVLGDMAEDGLHARWTSLRAADVGAPHGRERLFVIAYPADTDPANYRRQGRTERDVWPDESRFDSSHRDDDGGLVHASAHANDNGGGRFRAAGTAATRCFWAG